MFSLIGVAGVAIDVGSWYQSKQSLQAAADAAALAGASQILASWSAANAVAEDGRRAVVTRLPARRGRLRR